jgi:hypothetical protein
VPVQGTLSRRRRHAAQRHNAHASCTLALLEVADVRAQILGRWASQQQHPALAAVGSAPPN